MKTDDFENLLQRQSQREIPGAWREEILAKARESTTASQPSRLERPSLFQLIQTLISHPQRVAWAGLVGVWLMIFVMNFAAQSDSNTTAQSASLPTPETLQALKQQRQLLAELVDRPTVHVADRNKAIPTGPRSQRREDPTSA